MSPVSGGHRLRRLIVVASAIAVACAPVLTGLRGNQSFAQSVPVVIPSDARVMKAGDFESEASSSEPSPRPSLEDSRMQSGKELRRPRVEPSQVDDSPSGSPSRTHGSDGPSAKPSFSAKAPAGRRPASPTAAPASPIEASPNPSATVDDHRGGKEDLQSGRATAAPATIGIVETSAAPAPLSSDDSGGHGGGGSGKGGGSH